MARTKVLPGGVHRAEPQDVAIRRMGMRSNGPGPRRRVLGPVASATVLVLLAASALAACSAGAASPGSTAPPSSPSTAPSASGEPASAGPIASASPAGSVGPVETAAQAAALVLASDPRFAKIGPKDPDLIGQSSWYTVDAGPGDAWTVQVRIGWGDCQSGCIDEHLWTYEVARNGQLTLLNETGPAVPSDATQQP